MLSFLVVVRRAINSRAFHLRNKYMLNCIYRIFNKNMSNVLNKKPMNYHIKLVYLLKQDINGDWLSRIREIDNSFLMFHNNSFYLMLLLKSSKLLTHYTLSQFISTMLLIKKHIKSWTHWINPKFRITSSCSLFNLICSYFPFIM